MTQDYVRWRLRQATRRAQDAPAAALHWLRWHLWNRDRTDAWVASRLQLHTGGWVFLLGVHNSGTSLLAQLLARHPSMRSLPRAGQGLTSALPTPRLWGVSRTWTERPDVFRLTERDSGDRTGRVQFDWARHFEARPGLLLEKSPPNTVRSRWLQRYFRPGRFVGIVRHPFAVCEGMRRREGLSLEAAARHWRRAHEYLREDIPQLTHVMLCAYEDFCAAPVSHLARIETFLGVPSFFDASIQRALHSTHNIHGSAQPVRNMNAESIARLTPDECAAIAREVGPLMSSLGYDSTAGRVAQSAPFA